MYGIIFLTGIIFLPASTQAVWEHAPITENTRLSDQASQPWEFGMVYHQATLYPAKFYSPGGAEVILHVLNLSEVPLIVTRANPKIKYRIAPKTYKTIGFGKLKFGDHLFFVDTSSGHTRDAETGEPSETLDRLKCYIHAKRWPGPVRAYRNAWIIKNNQLFPKKVVLPTGRKSDVFLGSLGQTSFSKFQVSDYEFLIKPNAVTLTELRSPAGESVEIHLPFKKPATIIFR